MKKAYQGALKVETRCLIDHKWPYNGNLSAPPFDRLRVVSVVEPQSWGCPPRRAVRHGGLGGRPKQELGPK